MKDNKTIVIPPQTTEEARAFLEALIVLVHEVFGDPEIQKKSERVYRMSRTMEYSEFSRKIN